MQLQPKPKLYTQSVYKFFKHFKAHGKPILHPAVIRILGDLKNINDDESSPNVTGDVPTSLASA
jgi:hypothetical protein